MEMKMDNLSRILSYTTTLFRAFALGLVIITVSGTADAQNNVKAPTAPRCDAACLTTAMDDYLTKMLGHRTDAIQVASDARIFLNTQSSRLHLNPLSRVKEIKSKQVFCDPETGNVVARTGLEMNDGKIAYASTRLKITGGTITQVETSFDDSPRVVASYVTDLNPLMTQAVPVEQRMPRADLKAIVERYFQALTDHKPVAADYDDGCDRYHSGATRDE